MIDIDDFKFYNDKYGHIVGDLILKHITKIIKDIFSPPDIVARYGGEEFVCLLIGREKEGVIKWAEKVKSSIAKHVPTIRRKKINVTVSIGISFFPQDANFKEELVKIADERLYKAKQRGKNKVVYN
jgi:diguanylate cyclase (GGDEF)-like protein